MIQIEIPGRDIVTIEHLVLDYNGTIAEDGFLIDGVEDRLDLLSESVLIHVLTADTYGTVRAQCEPLGLMVETFPTAGAGQSKMRIVETLGENVMCIGNGYNDLPMFGKAALSVAVIEKEGACGALIGCADVVTTSIVDALDLIIRTNRLRATLRS